MLSYVYIISWALRSLDRLIESVSQHKYPSNLLARTCMSSLDVKPPLVENRIGHILIGPTSAALSELSNTHATDLSLAVDVVCQHTRALFVANIQMVKHIPH